MSASATSYADTTAAAGSSYYYVVKAVNGLAVSPASNEAGVAMPTSSGSIIPVNLASYYNVTAVTVNGADTNVGLDGAGNSFSESEVGTSVRWSGINFSIGPSNTNDAVQGVTIALPAGNYSGLSFLAVGNSGDQTSQTFTINYTDGTSTIVTQSLSDWGSPQDYLGESVALSTGYRNSSNGSGVTGTYDMYGYSFAVNPAKTVESITLPDNGNVKIFSMVLLATA